MKEGKHGHQHVHALLLDREPCPALHGIGDQIGVAQHGALGHARRAARILEDRRIARLCLVLHGRCRLGAQKGLKIMDRGLLFHRDPLPVDHCLEGIEQVERKGKIVLHVAEEEMLYRRLRHYPLDQGIEHVQRDERRCTAVIELHLQLMLEIQGVGRHGHRACPDRSVIGDDHLRNVRQHECHAVALLHAQGGEGAGEPVRQAVQLGKGDLFSKEDERCAVGKLRGSGGQHAAEGEVRIVKARGDPLLIIGAPGPVFVCSGGSDGGPPYATDSSAGDIWSGGK